MKYREVVRLCEVCKRAPILVEQRWRQPKDRKKGVAYGWDGIGICQPCSILLGIPPRDPRYRVVPHISHRIPYIWEKKRIKS